MADIFQTPATFRTHFTCGLIKLLDTSANWLLCGSRRPDLGPIVLACANASFDPAICGVLHPHLEQIYHLFRADSSLIFRAAALSGDDDLVVLTRIGGMGLGLLPRAQHKMLGDWAVQLNPLRALRPRRSADQTVKGIRQPFNPAAFNFNMPSLEIERFWTGALAKRTASLFFNKYPFARLHSLLVPDQDKGREQYLEKEDHIWAWRVTKECATLPGFALGYNSLGAFASVNHLHFQLFVDPDGLPVTLPKWVHNGGLEKYPAQCFCFDSPQRTWTWLLERHAAERAYNLLYTPGRIYCFPRRHQGTYKTAPWTSGFAWYEMSGGVITSKQQHFDSLTPELVAEELHRVSLD